ncbi:hypothetical protein [Streptomyces sp. NPDC005209]|uniref:hypothetical protein n=1 Tax=Streptomyces sp. NPDC005209 TaxID=3156715 RepID=UPI0033AC1298
MGAASTVSPKPAADPFRDTRHTKYDFIDHVLVRCSPSPLPGLRGSHGSIFGLPLWLQAQTRHGRLWAYNPEHLKLIRQFVQAPLRERAPWDAQVRKMTLIARLPAWIKSAKNRGEVLRTIERIQSSLVMRDPEHPGHRVRGTLYRRGRSSPCRSGGCPA